MQRVKNILLVLACISLLAQAVVFTGAGDVLAETKEILVQVTNIPLPVTGTVQLASDAGVKVTNTEAIPVTGTVNVDYLPPAATLRHGRMSLNIDTHYEREALPGGIVLTDLVIFGRASSGDEGCFVALEGPMPSGGTWILIRLPFSNADPVAQVHLNSGLPSSSASPLGLYLSSTSFEKHCEAWILWTGYEE